MSVLKSKRKTSRLEFLHTAYKIRKNITELLLRDFGVKAKVRNSELYTRINRMSPEDTEQFLEIVDKYGIRNIVDEYPEWLISDMRVRVMSEVRFLIRNIIQANTLYPTTMDEWTERRKYQSQAIGCCEQILQELQYILTVIDINVNKYLPYVDLIEKEIALLRAWRKSDNRLLKKIYANDLHREIEREKIEKKVREEYDYNNQQKQKRKKKHTKDKTETENTATANNQHKSYADRFIREYTELDDDEVCDAKTIINTSVNNSPKIISEQVTTT